MALSLALSLVAADRAHASTGLQNIDFISAGIGITRYATLNYIIVGLFLLTIVAVAIIIKRRYDKVLLKAQALNAELMLAVNKGEKILVFKYIVATDSFYSIRDNMTLKKEFSLDEFQKYIHPHYRNKFTNNWNDMLSGRKDEIGFICKLYDKKDKCFHLYRLDWQAIKKDSKVIEVIGTQKKVTDIDQIEADLYKRVNQLNTIYSTIPTGLEQFDKDGYLVEANELGLEMFGLNKESVIGNFNFFTSDIIPQHVRDKLRKGESGTFVFEHNFDYTNVNSTYKSRRKGMLMVELRVTPMYDEFGNLIGGLALTNDITENYNLNSTYQRLYKRNNAILETIPVSIEIYDNNGFMTYCNKTTLDMFGMSGDLTGKLNLFNNPNVTREIIERAQREGIREEELVYDFEKVKTSNYYSTSKSGKLHIRCSSKVVKDKDGNVTDYLIVASDMTQQLHFQRQIREANEDLVLAIKAGNSSIWNYNVATNMLEFLDRYDKVGEMDFDEHLKLKNPDDAKMIKDTFNRIIAGKEERASFVFRYFDDTKPDGYRYCQTHVIAKKRHGKVVQLTGTERDISDEHFYHRNLELNKIKTELAIKSGNMVQWDFDCTKRLFTVFDHLNDYEQRTLTIEKFLDFIHPDDRKEALQKVDLMLAGDSNVPNCEFRLRLPHDEEYSYCELYVTPYEHDTSGKIVKYTGIRRNNTSWHKLNEQLKEVDKMKQIVLDNASSGLIYLSPDFIVQWENATEKYDPRLKPGVRYHKGMVCYTCIGRREPCEVCAVREAIARRAFVQKEVPLADGKIIKEAAMPVMNDEGEIEGIVVRLNDYTYRKKFLDELKAAKDEAESANKLKSAFLANMSHEIRTPLNAIVGFSELALTADDPKDKEEYGKIISTNSDLLLNLINDILDLSKIESGFMKMVVTEFDLSDMYRDLQMLFTMRMKAGIDFTVINPYEKCLLTMDKQRLQQVITNFMTNAIKYTKEGSITLGYESVHNGVRVYVTDTGIGISEDNKKKVFKRFEKFDTFAQGTGLGLSICKAISDTNNGRIGFESELGKGSTFWMWLPYKLKINGEATDDTAAPIIVGASMTPELPVKTEISATATLADNATAQPASQTAKESKTASTETNALDVENNTSAVDDENIKAWDVLIAEDNDSNYLLIKAMLKGYSVTRAVNGADAVRMVSENNFGIVFMDIKMPVMDGLEATREIRKFNKKIPIVALTANAFDSDRDAAFEAGCNQFLAKPLKRSELLGIFHRGGGIFQV